MSLRSGPELEALGQWSLNSQHAGQVQFGVSGLEAALERGLESALGFGVARTLAEEIGIATEVLHWRERDRVDPLFDCLKPIRAIRRGGAWRGFPAKRQGS